MSLLILSPLLYILFTGICYLKWTGMSDFPHNNGINPGHGFSVIVAFRNEEPNLPSLLHAVDKLDYPHEKFEILFIDDHSSDNGPDLISTWSLNKPNVRLIRLHAGAGKKAAIEKGISESSFDYIVCTDADCRMEKGWLKAYRCAFAQSDAAFIAGPLHVEGSASLAGTFQEFEQAALTAIGGISIEMGYPTMCNGANMAFSKTVFQEVGGYAGNRDIPSGDDQFLLKKINDAYPGSIHFLRNADSLVTTPAQNGISELVNQRVRWAAKWKATGGWLSVLAVFTGLTYLSILALMVFAITIGDKFLVAFAVVFVIKTLADVIFVAKVSYARNSKARMVWWPVIELFYPIYTVLIIWKSMRGQYLWKGRRYSSVAT